MTDPTLPPEIERDLNYLCECKDTPGDPGETMARLRQAIAAALVEQAAECQR